MVTEIWKVVRGWERYQVSNLGRIKITHRLGRWGNIIKKDRILKLLKAQDGYYSVILHNGDKNLDYRLHRLILETFIGPCPNGHQGLHKDDNKVNNRLDNLYWGTKEQNIEDAHRNGKIKKGVEVKLSKFTEDEIRFIRTEYQFGVTGFGIQSLATKYKVDFTTMSSIVKHKTWKHVL